MATQMQMIQALIDKVADQGAKAALLQREIELQTKRADMFERTACSAEKELSAAVIHTNKLIFEKHELKDRVARLESELEDARLILEPLTQCNDLVEGLTYKDMAVDFVQKWGQRPADPYAGLVEYKEAVSNGR